MTEQQNLMYKLGEEGREHIPTTVTFLSQPKSSAYASSLTLKTRSASAAQVLREQVSYSSLSRPPRFKHSSAISHGVFSTASTSRDSDGGKLKVKETQEEQAWLEWGTELEDGTKPSP